MPKFRETLKLINQIGYGWRINWKNKICCKQIKATNKLLKLRLILTKDVKLEFAYFGFQGQVIKFLQVALYHVELHVNFNGSFDEA